MKFDFNDKKELISISNSNGTTTILTVERTVEYLKNDLGVYGEAVNLYNLYDYNSLKSYLKALTSKRGTGKRVIMNAIIFRSVKQACLYMGLNYDEAVEFISFLRCNSSSKMLSYGESLKAFYQYTYDGHSWYIEFLFESFKDKNKKYGGEKGVWKPSFYKDDVELAELY